MFERHSEDVSRLLDEANSWNASYWQLLVFDEDRDVLVLSAPEKAPASHAYCYVLFQGLYSVDLPVFVSDASFHLHQTEDRTADLDDADGWRGGHFVIEIACSDKQYTIKCTAIGIAYSDNWVVRPRPNDVQ